MCLYPRLLLNPKYKKNKKNGGNIPAIIDNRVLIVPIACGNCIECRKSEQRKWQIRLSEDIKEHKNGIFITLTFSNESICKIIQQKHLETFKGYALDNAIATCAVRMWLERWRKKFKKSLRHWLVTELGHNGTENIHLHGIIWTDEPIKTVANTWSYGYIWPKDQKTLNFVSTTTVNYITKYIKKIDFDHKHYKPKILTSSGIGASYIQSPKAQRNTYSYQNTTKDNYTTETGHKIQLPIYYRNKIYTEHERELLWLEKLDQQKRYILGTEIDISNGLHEYLELLQLAREKNTKLGYGSYLIDYEQKEYEELLRTINQLKRTNNTKRLAGEAVKHRNTD